MDIIGVIFDFNGTMLFDRIYHLAAWKCCVEDLTLRKLSEEDVLQHIDGKGPKEILPYFLGDELTEPMIHQFAEEKERIYRSMLVKEHPEPAPGLVTFLDYLKGAGIPMAIASSAPIENMNLYYDQYELFRWFDWDHILNASADLPAKPHPALYQAAVKIVGIPADRCLVFEDASVGIQAAYAAGIRNIVHVVSDMPEPEAMSEEDRRGIICTIHDYTELKQ